MAGPKQVAARVTPTERKTTTTTTTTSAKSFLESTKVAVIDNLLLTSHEILSAEQIQKVVCEQMEQSKEGEETRSRKKSNNVPKQVCALVDYILDM